MENSENTAVASTDNNNTATVSTPDNGNTGSQGSQSTPVTEGVSNTPNGQEGSVTTPEVKSEVPKTNRERWNEIQAKIAKDPYDYTNEDIEFLNQIDDKKLTLEPEAPPAPVIEPMVPEVQATSDKYDKFMGERGIESIDDIPEKVEVMEKAFFEKDRAQTQEIQELKAYKESMHKSFDGIMALMDGMERGDPKAFEEFRKHRQAANPSYVPSKATKAIDPDLIVDREVYDHVDERIRKLEEREARLAKVEQEKAAQVAQQEYQKQQQQAADEGQRKALDELCNVAEKYKTYGLTPAQIRTDVTKYYAELQNNPKAVPSEKLRPIVELINYADKYSKENNVRINLDTAHKLRMHETEGDRTAKAINEGIKKAVKTVPTANTLAGETNRGGTANEADVSAIMTKLRADPLSYKDLSAAQKALLAKHGF